MSTHQLLHCQDEHPAVQTEVEQEGNSQPVTLAPSIRQGEQDAKISRPSKSSRLTDVVCFVTATTFVITGIVLCILNIVNVIPGPWAAIIGVLFAGIGLIAVFYTLFLQPSKG